jgi:hypothetical protein
MSAPSAPITIAWMPLSDDASLHRDVLARARSYGVSQLHLSHAICHDADDLLDDAARATRVAALVRDCRTAGLGVWCWTHEVCKPPAACLHDGKLDFDQPSLWTHLAEKYRRFLKEVLPDLDGLVLTCAETDFLVYQDAQLQSSRGRASRTARLALALHEACNVHGRKLALRDFVYRRAEVDDMARAIAECRPDLIIMTKSVPHDWHPFYPPNPLLGAVGGREQWMEFDFGHEYEGQHLYPYAEVEVTLGRLRHGFERSVRTVVARLDRAVEFRGASALHSPWGRLELLTLQRFAENPRIDAEEIWREWGAAQFPAARRAVEAATRAVQHLLFPQQFWYADHSRLPTWEYAASHLVDGNADRLPQWTGDERHLERDRNFRSMPEPWLRELLAEAERGLELARESAAAIAQATLPAADAAAWRAGAESLLAWMELFARHRAAFFQIEFARHHPGRVSAGELDAALDELEQACTRWTPRLIHQRLENMGATANFPSMLASLRAARARVATAQPIAI